MVHSQSPFDTPHASLESDRPTGGPVGTNGRESMAYWDAFVSYFRLPTWGKNLFFMALCVLIPVVGTLALQGYFIGHNTRQHWHGEEDRTEFTWDRFGEYIGRGVWPFLVALLTALVFVPVFGIFMGGGIAMAGAGISEAVVGVVVVFGGLIAMVLMFALSLAIQPVALRASYMQQMGGAFDMTFVRDFLSKVWLETLLGGLFTGLISFGLVILGYMTCGLGLYPAIALMLWTQHQMHRQVYEVYLYRGGIPIDFAPALVDNP